MNIEKKNLQHLQEKEKNQKVVDLVLCFAFKVIGRTSDQHHESEFSVTMRTAGTRKHKVIWCLLKLANLLIQINVNNFHRVPSQPPLSKMRLPCHRSREQWALKALLSTSWTLASNDLSHFMNVLDAKDSNVL